MGLPSENTLLSRLDVTRAQIDAWTLQLREDPEAPWDELREALASEGVGANRTTVALFFSEDVDEYSLMSLSDNGLALGFSIRVPPQIDQSKRSLHLEGRSLSAERFDPFGYESLYCAACRLRDEGSAIDPLLYLEQYAEWYTDAMRTDPDPMWRGFARLLAEEGIDPSRTILFDVVEKVHATGTQRSSTIALIDPGGRIVECGGRTEGLHSIPVIIDERSQISKDEAEQRYGPLLEAAIRLASRPE